MNCNNIKWASLWENGVVGLYCVLCDWVSQTLWLRCGIVSSKEISIRIFSSLFSSWSWSCSKCYGVFVGFPTGSSHHLNRALVTHGKDPANSFPSQAFLQPLSVTSQQIWKPVSGRPWYSRVWSADQRQHHPGVPLEVQALRPLLWPSELEFSFNKVSRWLVGTLSCGLRDHPHPLLPPDVKRLFPRSFIHSTYTQHLLCTNSRLGHGKKQK